MSRLPRTRRRPQALLVDFLEWSRVTRYAEETVRVQAKALGYFFAWCEERGLTRPQEVTRPVLQRYQRHLFLYRQASGKPLSWASQHQRLICVRSFFRWLTRNSYILYNPASELELPRRMHRLPRAILTASEAEQVLNQADVATPLGVRDRAILETLYSTGVRRKELIGLGVFDVNLDQGLVMVRQGKGGRDRLIPIGERAVAWVDKYLIEVRPSLAVEPDDGALFLSEEGRALALNQLSKLAKRYIESAAVGKTGSCHLFRHTMATLMLENGADLRFIQQMLGHAEISTTQIYTQVAVKKLKEIHTVTHPARLERSTAGASADPADDPASARKDLAADLAAEAADEEA